MPYLTEQEIQHQKLPIYINGDFNNAKSDVVIDSIDPATGQGWYQINDCNNDDVEEAVAAASTAFSSNSWRNLTATDRGDLLYQLAEIVRNHTADFADIESRDNGKLIKETSNQIGYLARYYRYFAGIADKIMGDVIPINRGSMLNYTSREPIGVVGLIVPWNSPLNTMSVTAAACLAAGNTLVIKPSEHTSASTLAFANLIKQAGFPDGVFNVITGRGATTGELLTKNKGIAKIAFTGGTATGTKIATNAASHLAPCILELGGKSPQVIFDDADVDRAVNGVVAGVFAAAGQTCVAGSRCFVQKGIVDEVTEKLLQRTQNIKIGHPKDPKTHIGPLATREQHQKVADYVKYGVEDGARLISGGEKYNLSGYEGGFYFQPTLFAGVNNQSRIAQDEIFGPVVGIQSFENESDLMERANASRYGLASGVWTQDIDRAMRFIQNIDAGTVWVNTYRTAAFMTPMGGFKDSGYGKHNGFDGMHEWTRSKNVMIDYSGATQDAFVMRLK